MLVLKGGLAEHSGLGVEQVDTLFGSMSQEIALGLPQGLPWDQVLWRLIAL